MKSIRNLFDDDSAVSPVIGVILMVAITVILAAVIASFVLGLGDQTDDVSPNIQINADHDLQSSTNTTTLTIQTTDNDVDNSTIRVRGNYNNATNPDQAWPGEIQAGNSIEIANDTSADVELDGELETGDEIVIVFETESTSDELARFEVPEQ